MTAALHWPQGVPRQAGWPGWPGLVSVTFTGVDEATVGTRLEAISARWPAAEWGVLYSAERAGRADDRRYPTLEWIQAWVIQAPLTLRRALHLCGSAAHAWIAGDPGLRQLAQHFNRLQLNVAGERTEIAILQRALAEGAHPAVITQHHARNQALTDALTGFTSHAVLFDQSGGQGRLPEEEWPWPLEDRPVGYAGGLGPATIVEQAHRIQTQTGGRPHWLDMEQALRAAHDQLDLDRVEAVLMALDHAG